MAITVELSDDEALVLFDLLSEYGEDGNDRRLEIGHAAERNVLWGLTNLLEQQLVAPLQADYAAQLDAARKRIEAQGGAW